jgi:hypothetical protein
MELFKLNEELSIGYKMLTEADLGISEKTHQTHIGLSSKVFTFMPNTMTKTDSLFIYESICDFSDIYYDLIKNPDGTYRSPKIRKGNRESSDGQRNNSVVVRIRDFVSAEPNNKWFLVYFGLENGLPVFILVKENTILFEEFIQNNIPLSVNCRSNINESSENFDQIRDYLLNFLLSKIEHITNQVEERSKFFNETLLFDDSSIDEIPVNSRHIDIDPDELKNKCKEIGRAGEELVNVYLGFLVKNNKIAKFDWVNKNKETGRPYDIQIITNSDEIIFLDVKTTIGKSTADFHFSDRELDFLSKAQVRNNYRIYRVYDLSSDYSSAKLRIIKNFSNCVDNLKNAKLDFTVIIQSDENVSIGSMDCKFKPKEELFSSNEILISKYIQEMQLIESTLIY